MMMKTGILLRPLLIISILFNIQICADVIDLTDATFELDTKVRMNPVIIYMFKSICLSILMNITYITLFINFVLRPLLEHPLGFFCLKEIPALIVIE